MRIYKNKKNVTLIPVYEKGMIVEVNGAEYRKLIKEFPEVGKKQVFKNLDATQRQALWLCGVKVVQTAYGVFRLF